jgi:hypothetical protein
VEATAAAAATTVAATAAAAAAVAATTAAAAVAATTTTTTTTAAATATTAAGIGEGAGRSGQHQGCDQNHEMTFHGVTFFWPAEEPVMTRIHLYHRSSSSTVASVCRLARILP